MPPRQVAEITLAAIEEGCDQAYAYEGTEELYRAVRFDPQRFRTHVQQLWDEGDFPTSEGALTDS